MPRGSAAHAEAADEDAVLIHVEVLLDIGEGFEEVDFAGEGAGVAIAAVEMDDDGVARGELAGVVETVPEEVHFAEGLAAAVKPGVGAPASRSRMLAGVELVEIGDEPWALLRFCRGGDNPARQAWRMPPPRLSPWLAPG